MNIARYLRLSSTKQLYDIIEMLDVYDSLKEEAKKRAKQEAAK